MKSAESRSPSAVATMLPLVFRTLGVVAVLSLPGVSVIPQGLSSGASDQAGPGHAKGSWRGAWSERYPGCVARVLWPADETPVAAVVRGADGTVARVTLDARRGPVLPVVGGSDTLGLCR